MIDYVIVGGGTAGWLVSLYIQKHLPPGNITVIASSEIGILGAGEGTTPDFMELLKQIDVPAEGIIQHASGTIKKGIQFTNWNGDETGFFHPFWGQYGDTALHFNANQLAQYLQSIGESRGIKLIDDKVTNIITDENDYITGFDLESGNKVNANFVFDCSGFKRLIIGNHYKSPWHSYANSLPVNRAMPFFIENDGVNLPEYTEAIAMKYGWMWKIPVQGRYGCGYVFDSSFATDEEIKQELEEYLGHEIVSPRMFSFNAGCYEKMWIKNCVAIGLSSGFTEPLEATSIWVQVKALKLLADKFRIYGMNNEIGISEFNSGMRQMNEEVLSFLNFHYHTKRKDSEFWTTFATKNDTPHLTQGVFDISKNTILDEKDLNYLIDTMPTKIGRDHIKTFNIKSWYRVGAGIKKFNRDYGIINTI
jgi:tryptophan halogenase